MTARSALYDECFHSLGGAAQEALQLYIVGSGIELFWQTQAQCCVLDLGLGLGYNALTTLSRWLNSPVSCQLNLISIEQDPALVQHLVDRDGPWMRNWPADWLEILSGLGPTGKRLEHPVSGQTAHWQVCIGDAVDFLEPALTLIPKYNFVWHDPFSPAKNPGLWTPEFFRTLAGVSQQNATLMTYSVARATRDALNAAGWQWEKIPGLGSKRAWLKSKLAD